jgi:DNA-directed RNA polymerase specialized sigma24 family protein
MAISEELLDKAMKSDRAAMEAVLVDVYPAVFRVANALTGRAGAARLVLNDVLRRSLRVLPKWRRGVVPENWYYHHTIIAARQAAAAPPELRDDVLVKLAGTQDPTYLAFVRALRSLPRQQSEAFLLHHGERLNTRLVGVAMDSSQQAAAEHLKAADAAMATVGGEAMPALTATLLKAYAALVPPANSVHPAARKYVNRHRAKRMANRLVKLALLLGLLAAACLLWLSRDPVRALLRPYLESPASQPATRP